MIVLLALFLLLAMALSRVLYFVIKRTPLIDRLKEKNPEKALLSAQKCSIGSSCLLYTSWMAAAVTMLPEGSSGSLSTAAMA